MRSTSRRFGSMAAIAGALAGSCAAQPAGELAPGHGAGEDAPAVTAPLDLAQYDEMRRFGLAEAPAKAPGTFRLATYNIENLFDGVDDPALSGDNEDIDDEKPAHELAGIARAIRRLDADVLCVQEVESEEALLAFRDAYLSDMGYDHVVSIDAGAARGIEQSVLSRFPVSEGENWAGKELGGVHPEKYGPYENWHAGEAIAFRRSPLVVDVHVPAGARGNEVGYDLTVVVVHHKSGRHAGYWREAESRGVLDILDALSAENPARNIAVLGDFNAVSSDRSVRAYLDAGFEDLGAQIRSRSGSITHESERRIDLILANENFAREVSAGSVFVLGTPARPDGIDWRDLPTFEGYASDHYPVAVDVTPVERDPAPGG